eukprot:scaffold53803_cov52-Attheya_sp.AAC.3
MSSPSVLTNRNIALGVVTLTCVVGALIGILYGFDVIFQPSSPATQTTNTTTSIPTLVPTRAPTRAPTPAPTPAPNLNTTTSPTVSSTSSPTPTGTFVIEPAGSGEIFGFNSPKLALYCIIAVQGIIPSATRRTLREEENRKLGGADAFVGEIAWVPFDFAPSGWELCNGQFLQISSFQNLFNMIGNTYGGAGTTTFALPDVRGRALLHTGTGSGLSARTLGSKVGEEVMIVSLPELASHVHGALKSTGSSQPMSIMPPSTTLQCIIAIQGSTPRLRRRNLNAEDGPIDTEADPIFSRRRRLGNTPFVGEMVWVAFSMLPNGWARCDGEPLQINRNERLYDLIGFSFGGNDINTFALPDVRGRQVLAAGSGFGLTRRIAGVAGGAETVTLQDSNLPSHTHSTVSPTTGTGAVFSLMSPYLTLNVIIALTGNFPTSRRLQESESDGPISAAEFGTDRMLNAVDPFLGEIMWVPYNFAPIGWALCDGSVLNTNEQPELFALIGNKFGGNGVNTFALPDLRGRTMIHSGNGPNLLNKVLGTPFGTETHSLTEAQMATHTHVR